MEEKQNVSHENVVGCWAGGHRQHVTRVLRARGQDRRDRGGRTPVVQTQVVTATPAPPAPTAKPKRPNVVRASFGSGDVPSLDPNIAEDTSSITVIENTFGGVTHLDEVTSALGPGMAEKWDISPDGKVYTFKIRNNVPWVRWDGKKVVKCSPAR